MEDKIKALEEKVQRLDRTMIILSVTVLFEAVVGIIHLYLNTH